MKTFSFYDLKSRGDSPRASTGYLQPSVAIVCAVNLGEARRHLRDMGLAAKSFRLASASEAEIVDDYAPGTVAWTTSDTDEWLVGISVDKYVQQNPSWNDRA